MRSELDRQLADWAKVDAKVKADQDAMYTPWFTNEYVSVGPFKASGFTEAEQAIIEQRRQEHLRNLPDMTPSAVAERAGKFGGRQH